MAKVKQENVPIKLGYGTVCVIEGLVVGPENVEAFVQNIRHKTGARIQYLEEVVTRPSLENRRVVKGTGGRNDVFFAVHDDDVKDFVTARFSIGARWADDVIGNQRHSYGRVLYPKRFEDYV
jgi:hypothetical protein